MVIIVGFHPTDPGESHPILLSYKLFSK